MITKKDIVRKMSEKLGKSFKEVDKIVTAYQNTIIDFLKDGEEVKQTGFMSYKIQDVPERERRNPRTGEKMICPAKKRISLKAGISMKNAVAE